MLLRRWLSVAVVSFALLSSGGCTSQTGIQMGHSASSTVEAPLDARVRALSDGDADRVVAQFTDDAMVESSGGRISSGHDEIRLFTEDQIRRSQREVLIGNRIVEGNVVKWSVLVSRDDWRALGIDHLQVNQEAVVEHGRIKRFTNTFSSEAARRLKAAREAALAGEQRD
jgi:hypothetical protein